jgi:hypothetical protein
MKHVIGIKEAIFINIAGARPIAIGKVGKVRES